jgi:hypothetical protein
MQAMPDDKFDQLERAFNLREHLFVGFTFDKKWIDNIMIN